MSLDALTVKNSFLQLLSTVDTGGWKKLQRKDKVY